MEPIGLIAGAGNLPLHIAREAAERGHPVISICFSGFTDVNLDDVSKETHWLKLGRLDKLIEILKERGIVRAVLAGKIEKSNMLRPWNVRPDKRCLQLVRNLKDWRDDTILTAITNEFRKDGIVIEELSLFASKLMAPLGILTKKSPTDKQWTDIEFGRTMALGIGGLDIGQTVVVKNSAVIAVEAIEGTDRAILRAKDLNVSAAVVVKMAKPAQDMRFDVPGIGQRTIKSMVEAKAKTLAVEAGKTMIADITDTLRAADREGIAIVGIPAHGPVRN